MRTVWAGAAFTGILFALGQLVLSLYLGWQSDESVYGAAGSLIVLLLWVYYAAQILFFGAEYTQVTAKRRGRPIVPARGAEPIAEAAREQQGMAHRNRAIRSSPASLPGRGRPRRLTAGYVAGLMTRRWLQRRNAAPS